MCCRASKTARYAFIRQKRQVQNFIQQTITATFAFNKQSLLSTYCTYCAGIILIDFKGNKQIDTKHLAFFVYCSSFIWELQQRRTWSYTLFSLWLNRRMSIEDLWNQDSTHLCSCCTFLCCSKTEKYWAYRSKKVGCLSLLSYPRWLHCQTWFQETDKSGIKKDNFPAQIRCGPKNNKTMTFTVLRT